MHYLRNTEIRIEIRIKTKIKQTWRLTEIKVKFSRSLIDVGAVGVRVPLYLGHS